MNFDIRPISKKYFSHTVPQNFIPASATLGSGTNGTVTVYSNQPTTDVEIEIVLGEDPETPLSAVLEDGVITVTLATTDDLTPTADSIANKASLIAAEISKIEGFTAVASGNGTSSITTETDTNIQFSDGQEGTPCPEVGLGFVTSNGTYYVCTKADNSIYNNGWKTFVLGEIVVD